MFAAKLVMPERGVLVLQSRSRDTHTSKPYNYFNKVVKRCCKIHVSRVFTSSNLCNRETASDNFLLDTDEVSHYCTVQHI